MSTKKRKLTKPAREQVGREKAILFYVTPEQHDTIKQAAYRRGQYMGPWLRQLALAEAAKNES